jgi:hypothetical protein
MKLEVLEDSKFHIQNLCQMKQSSFPNHHENMVVVASNDISIAWPFKQMVGGLLLRAQFWILTC